MIIKLISRKFGGYTQITCDKFYTEKTDTELKVTCIKRGRTSIVRMGLNFLPRIKVVKK